MSCGIHFTHILPNYNQRLPSSDKRFWVRHGCKLFSLTPTTLTLKLVHILLQSQNVTEQYD